MSNRLPAWRVAPVEGQAAKTDAQEDARHRLAVLRERLEMAAAGDLFLSSRELAALQQAAREAAADAGETNAGALMPLAFLPMLPEEHARKLVARMGADKARALLEAEIVWLHEGGAEDPPDSEEFARLTLGAERYRLAELEGAERRTSQILARWKNRLDRIQRLKDEALEGSAA